MYNIKYSKINPFRDIKFKSERYISLFNSRKTSKKENKNEEKFKNKSLYEICLMKCSKLTDRIDFYSVPFHIGKEIILKAKDLREIISLETIQHLSYAYEDEIEEFPYYMKQLRIWNRSLNHEQLLGLSNLSRLLTHLDLKLANINDNSIVFLNCLINLKFLDLSLNPQISDYGIGKMLVMYYGEDNKNNKIDLEGQNNSRMCYENLQMLNLSYNPLISDQFMFRYCDKFKSLKVLEVSNTNISSVGISYFLKQQKNKWGLLESDYHLFDEYNDNSYLNPFEDYYNNAYDIYHKDRNNLKNPLSNMICKPVKPIKIDIEKLMFCNISKDGNKNLSNNYLKDNNILEEKEKEKEIEKEKNFEKEENDLEESLLYNSVFRGQECYIEDRPSFNWHKNRETIKQNTINYTWKLFRKIPLNSGVIRFINNRIITVPLENKNSNKRDIKDNNNNNNIVPFKKSKNINDNTKKNLINMINDIYQ